VAAHFCAADLYLRRIVKLAPNGATPVRAQGAIEQVQIALAAPRSAVRSWELLNKSEIQGSHPPGAKARVDHANFSGTAEAVPIQNRSYSELPLRSAHHEMAEWINASEQEIQASGKAGQHSRQGSSQVDGFPPVADVLRADDARASEDSHRSQAENLISKSAHVQTDDGCLAGKDGASGQQPALKRSRPRRECLSAGSRQPAEFSQFDGAGRAMPARRESSLRRSTNRWYGRDPTL
jgi:hypothetical protein